MFENKQEKYLKYEDKIRQELGCYVNPDAITGENLFSVERTHILSGDRTERTILTFFNSESKNWKEAEVLMSRKEHRDLVNKLKYIKSNER